MKILKVKKENEHYYSLDFIRGYNLGAKQQAEIMPERKKGQWIRHGEIKNVYGGICIECSECGEKYVVQYIKDEKFCRNCGADMRPTERDSNV